MCVRALFTGAGGGAQGFPHAGQALYQLSYIRIDPSFLFYLFTYLFLKQGLLV